MIRNHFLHDIVKANLLNLHKCILFYPRRYDELDRIQKILKSSIFQRQVIRSLMKYKSHTIMIYNPHKDTINHHI